MTYRISNLINNPTESAAEDSFLVGTPAAMSWYQKKPFRVHLFALGDVGSMLLIGLRLMGRDCIREIGIYDVRPGIPERWEFELNQIQPPTPTEQGPKVRILKEEELFDCDLFLFCASLRVPPVSETRGDVRMAQFAANSGLVRKIASDAVKAGYQGLFGIVSDPVDPLCKVAMTAGIDPARVKGFGLGVMNARASYFAGKDERFADYLTEGRAYGPHGEDLVIVNSLTHYDEGLSEELTEKTVHANLVMREMGFKPYIAPALSSGAYSILAVLRGEWNYSSVWMDGAYFGCRNHATEAGWEVENPEIPEEVYARCRKAWENLKAISGE